MMNFGYLSEVTRTSRLKYNSFSVVVESLMVARNLVKYRRQI